MTHYEERLGRDLDGIRNAVVAAGGKAKSAFEVAVRAMLQGDHERAYEIVLGDLQINRDIRRLDGQCHAFVARHLPSAGHLRFVSAVLRINVEIERIGDYAVTVARETVQLSAPLPETIAADLEAMARHSCNMLEQAIEAFQLASADLARGAITTRSQVDTTFNQIFADLVAEGKRQSRPLEDLFALLVTFNRVERVSDLAKNICEEVVFADTGETKVPKVYRVAFVDQHNGCMSVMAELIAHKAFPDSGSYVSAGWAPVDALEPGFELFLNERGHSVEGFRPAPLSERVEALEDLHVIVSLEGDPRPHIGRIPFHTALQIWDVGPPPKAGLDRERADAALEVIYREIAPRVESLMTALRGREAS